MNGTVAVLQAPEEPPVSPSATPRPVRRAIRVLASIVAAVCVVVVVLPKLIGTTMTDIAHVFSTVTLLDFLVLLIVWIAGLLAHSFVLTGSLPGLRTHRALTLNVTGSAVANVLPFGGAAGMSLNFVMIRAWGMDTAAFAAFTVVTNVWVILLKLAMPLIAVVALLATGSALGSSMTVIAYLSTAALSVVLTALVAALSSRRAAEFAVRAVLPVIAFGARMIRRSPDLDRISVDVLQCRDNVAAVVGQHWAQLSLGMIGYAALQIALLWGCLHVVGGNIGVVAVLAAYAVDRVLTLAVITPGAAGFVEAGTAGALVALGGAPAVMAAGVLLYRAFTYAVDIPIGGLWLSGWLLARQRAAARTARGVVA